MAKAQNHKSFNGLTPTAARLTPLHDKTLIGNNGENNGSAHGFTDETESGIYLAEHPFIAKLTIRADNAHPAIAKKISEACGVAVPQACRFNESGHGDNGEDEAAYKRLIWLGPDELLLYCPLAQACDMEASLSAALRGTHAAVVDVSDYYTVLSLRGHKADALLNSECALDLRLKSFPASAAAGTLYANANILLQRLQAQSFDIQVRYSFAEYLWAHLAHGIKFL